MPAPSIPASRASEELLARRRGRQSVLEFTKATHSSFIENFHHREISDALGRVERGEIDRLMIFAPPRSGKSEMVSLRLPAWYLGTHPNRQILSVSYNDDLATHFGRQVRNTVSSGAYQRFFPGVELAQDSRAANRWTTKQEGSYLSVGLTSGITGHGAHIAIIDDPFKNREDADSQRMRDKVWAIYESDIQSRLMPGGAIVIMHTRWHEDDLAGRLIKRMLEETGDSWEILEYPAILGEGTPRERALFPDWFSLDDMKRRKHNTDKRTWSALYQQSPQPESGEYFQRDWFRRYKMGEQPENLSIYMASDFAVTSASEGGQDFTEHSVWGIDAADNMWAIDWWYGQTAADAWIDSLLNLAHSHEPLMWHGEGGPIRRAIEPLLKKRMEERGVYVRSNWVAPVGDKPTRARPFQARASMGKVFIPQIEWGDRLLDHLLRFPTSRLDHSVDCCALMGQSLTKLATGHVPVGNQFTKVDKWARKFSMPEQGSGDLEWKCV